MQLLENERIDDLELNGLKLIQDTKAFCFGIDAVDLANFVTSKNEAIVVDLGCGNGIIPVLLSAKIKYKKIYGIEIQPKVAELARRNITFNNLEDSIEIINEDLKNIVDRLGKASADIVVSNPPYRTSGCGKVNIDDSKAIARHEIACNLEDVIKNASLLLKPLGKFFMVHRPDRLVDIICTMRQYNLEPKNIKFIYDSKDKGATHVLLEGLKGGKKFVVVNREERR